jgi:hypothetical protein
MKLELKLRSGRSDSSAGSGISYPFGKNPGSIVMVEGTRRQGERRGSRLRIRAGIDG